MKKIKCKDCPYFSGIECHGFGEYHGECNLLKTLRKVFSIQYKVYDWRFKTKFTKDEVYLDNDSECMFLEFDND